MTNVDNKETPILRTQTLYWPCSLLGTPYFRAVGFGASYDEKQESDVRAVTTTSQGTGSRLSEKQKHHSSRSFSTHRMHDAMCQQHKSHGLRSINRGNKGIVHRCRVLFSGNGSLWFSSCDAIFDVILFSSAFGEQAQCSQSHCKSG